MDIQKMKKIRINKIFTGIAILIIIVSIIYFQNEIPNVIRFRAIIIYDKTIIHAMNNISDLIPKDEVLVASTNAPILAYFTRHYVKTPYGVSSKESLLDYYNKRNLTYLIVFENKSEVEALKSLFSSTGLKDLDNDFYKIANYTTDYSKIYLYQRKIFK